MAARKQWDFVERITAILSGRVQDVEYRTMVVRIAKKFGSTGYVLNLEDGRVKIVAEGKGEVLERFLDAIRIKDALIDVEDVEIEYSGATGEYANFYICLREGEYVNSVDRFIETLKELLFVCVKGFESVNEGIRGEIRDEN
jgi:acylphosphatase